MPSRFITTSAAFTLIQTHVCRFKDETSHIFCLIPPDKLELRPRNICLFMCKIIKMLTSRHKSVWVLILWADLCSAHGPVSLLVFAEGWRSPVRGVLFLRAEGPTFTGSCTRVTQCSAGRSHLDVTTHHTGSLYAVYYCSAQLILAFVGMLLNDFSLSDRCQHL